MLTSASAAVIGHSLGGMWTALIAAVAALSGVGLGKWLDVAGDKRRWLREEKLSAYSEFEAASMEHFVGGIGGAVKGSSERVQALRRLGDAEARISLVGSKGCVVAARSVGAETYKKPANPDLLTAALIAFRLECRKDLGTP
jgi:hypothetical protein